MKPQAQTVISSMSEGHLAIAVDALLDELVGSGIEVGLQVTVICNGRTLVDTARGVTDPRTRAPVDRDTLFWAGSTAKGVASSVAHVLVDRGDLGDDLRVVEVWPEFAAHGKGNATVRHVARRSTRPCRRAWSPTSTTPTVPTFSPATSPLKAP